MQSLGRKGFDLHRCCLYSKDGAKRYERVRMDLHGVRAKSVDEIVTATASVLRHLFAATAPLGSTCSD